MGKYTNDAKELLHLVGGRENIAAVSHCITRMRFVLNDPKKADIQKIEAMKVVKGSFTTGRTVPGNHREHGFRFLQRLHSSCRH